MSEQPVEVVLQPRRVISIFLQASTDPNLGTHIVVSQRLPLPYWILDYTVHPEWNASTGSNWVEIYLSAKGDESASAIVNSLNLVEEATKKTRAYAFSYYDHATIQVNRFETVYPYIYGRMVRTSILNGAFAVVNVQLVGDVSITST